MKVKTRDRERKWFSCNFHRKIFTNSESYYRREFEQFTNQWRRGEAEVSFLKCQLSDMLSVWHLFRISSFQHSWTMGYDENMEADFLRLFFFFRKREGKKFKISNRVSVRHSLSNLEMKNFVTIVMEIY